MTDNRIRALVEYIGTALPPDRSHWPAGWPREAEAALLDAIFAARVTYGTPTSGGSSPTGARTGSTSSTI
ncbi:hypothetical protein RE9425_32040 [Prescottella equi]|nr:hypothetical protein RE9425_32040 [Prescottella equi]